MKRLFKSFVVLLAIAATAIAPARAQNSSTSSLEFTDTYANGGATADDNVVWTVTSDGSESTFDNTKGIHYGTSKATVGYIELSTSSISGTITQVVVNAAQASGVDATVGVTVDGNAFGGDAQSLTTSAEDYTFTGSASGAIVVRVAKPSAAYKALYVKSIEVTYTPAPSGGGSTPEPPAPAVPHTVRFAAGNDGWQVQDVTASASAVAPAVLQNVMAGDSLVVTAPATLPGKVKSVKAVKYVAPAATVTTAPTATAAYIEANSTTALVNAGAANGGTMMYKVTTTNAQPASTDGFSTSIPTAEGRTAGTYYVWYYAKADADHSDSEIAGPVSVTLAVMTTVTINQSDWGTSGRSFTKDGVTVSVGNIDRGSGNLMGGGTFSTTLGKFTRIVVTTGSCEASGTGWSGSYSSMTWAGTPASTVSFSGNFMGMGMVQTTFVCTIAQTN